MDSGTVGAVPGAATGPWYVTTGQRFLGTITGVVCVVFGLFAAFSVFPLQIIGGLLAMVSGLVVLAFEAPFLVRQLTFLSGIAGFWEHRSQWYKVGIYIAMGIAPLFLASGFSIYICAAALIGTGVFYGVAAWGRRGTAMQPMAPAGPPFTGDPYGNMDKSGLVESQMYPNQSQYSQPGGFR